MESDWHGLQRLVEEVQEVFGQENRLLKAGQTQQHGALMPRKKELVEKLEDACTALKNLRQNKAHANSQQLRALQDRIMQLLMLDRENEQLLTKLSMGGLQVTQQRVSAQGVAQAYRQL